MIVEVTYFYERIDEDYEEYNKLWDENIHDIIIFQNHVPPHLQRNGLIQQILFGKTIFSVRFPTTQDLENNKIIKNIMTGRGFKYQNTTWFPSKVWIYQ